MTNSPERGSVYTPSEIAASWRCSERALRKLARDLGECHVVGKSMFLTDANLEAIRAHLFPDLVRAERAEAELEEMQRLENERRTRAGGDQTGKGFVYFLKCQDRVKIGFARDVARRMQAVQPGLPYPAVVIAAQEGWPALERDLHRRFAEYREHGEWFRLEGRLLKYIEGLLNA